MPMSHPIRVGAWVAALTLASMPLRAADSAELLQLRQEIGALRQDYEARLKALDERLRQAEAALTASQAAAATVAGPTAAQAAAERPPPELPMTRAGAQAAEPAAPTGASASTSGNGFNPAIALILSGSYASLSQDPRSYRISGFLTGSEIGPGVQGFSLGESELNITASVDPWFYGALNVALAADNSASVEEAYVDTTALPAGLRLRMGRFLSAIGYENDKHAHTWDFADAPLVYQAFLEGALKQDGAQLSALLPTEQFIEVGGGLGAAGPFPSGGDNTRQPGTATLFAHTGGDVGASHSWRAGLSMLWAQADGRSSQDVDSAGNEVSNVFTGKSRLAILDGVWKWAPEGNAQRTNFSLQGEYFRRVESGSLVYDSTGLALNDSYRSTQGGWYAQAVYQFMPAWRVGARYDRLDIGNVDAASNTANLYRPEFSPSRATLMLDWSPSEFSRLRLQYANDRARYSLSDNQFLIQYQMSLGTHGAHNY
jgi:hypothetical protein